MTCGYKMENTLLKELAFKTRTLRKRDFNTEDDARVLTIIPFLIS